MTVTIKRCKYLQDLMSKIGLIFLGSTDNNISSTDILILLKIR